MRVCFITRKFPPTLSGMSTYAFNFSRHLVREKTDLVVLSQYRPDNLGCSGYGDAPPQPLLGATVVGVPQINEITSGDFEKDIDVLVEKTLTYSREKAFDVIHAQYAYPCGVAAILAAKKLGVPAVVSMQGGDGHWFGTCCAQHAQTLDWILENASAVLFPTTSFRDRVRSRAKRASMEVVLPGAVDTEMFTRDIQRRNKTRSDLGIKDDQIAIVYHGRLDLRKGVAELVKGYASVPERIRSETVLAVAGVGPDAVELENMARLEIPESNLRWLGHLDYNKMPDLLSAGDIHCSPTYQEGFSNTLVEAASCGLPLLTTDTVGVKDVFHNGEDAILIPIKSHEAVRDALESLISDQDLRIRLGIMAQKYVREKFSWTNLTRNILELYKIVPNVSASISLPPSQTQEDCPYRKNPLLL